MKNRDQKTTLRGSSQQGQTFLILLVFISILLLGVMGLATDYAQVWAHRQMVQNAADAACQAGAADVFLNAVDPSASTAYSLDFSWIGAGYNCSTKTSSTPCRYAAFNGYTGSNVSVSFPSSLPGVAALSSNFGTIAYPYIQVKVTDAVALSFSKIISSTGTVTVSATSGCGLNPVNVPVPLVVLNQTVSGALSVSGAASVQILGGPNRAIQVDSGSASAVSASNVDLSLAGPAGTGADFAVFGGPATKPGGVNVGSTGKWISPATPFGDPWATVSTPSVPATAGSAKPVPFAVNGCPDPSGCAEFAGGNYSACSTGSIAPGGNGCPISPNFSSGGAAWQPSPHVYAVGDLIQPTSAQHNSGGFLYQVQTAGIQGAGPNPWIQTVGNTQADGTITWKNVGPISTSPNTAIFDPGLYYLGSGGINPGPNTTMRMSTANGDGTKGATFYFSTAAGTVSVGNNTGKSSACTSASPGSGSPNKCVVSYRPDGAASTAATGSILSRALQCPSGPANPSQVPATINGNILMGPCSGTYGSSDGKNRGFLFFQNRSTAANPSWGGGGQFLLSGFMYFHQTSSFGTTLSMQGGSGTGAYTLGNIVVDKISLGGNSSIHMILNPQLTFPVLRPTLLQ